MSEIKHPEAQENPLSAKLAEVGLVEFTRLVKTGEIPSLTTQRMAEQAWRVVQEQLSRVSEDELLEINVPKLDSAGKVQSKDGYVEHEKRFVFKRQHERKRLLKLYGLTEKQVKALEDGAS